MDEKGEQIDGVDNLVKQLINNSDDAVYAYTNHTIIVL